MTQILLVPGALLLATPLEATAGPAAHWTMTVDIVCTLSPSQSHSLPRPAPLQVWEKLSRRTHCCAAWPAADSACARAPAVGRTCRELTSGVAGVAVAVGVSSQKATTGAPGNPPRPTRGHFGAKQPARRPANCPVLRCQPRSAAPLNSRCISP